jgi:tRNA A-37 threonylcarbamoyl transferase component Bud32
VTIPSLNLPADVITWQALQAADFTFQQPFSLALQEGKLINVHEIVRVLPQRRLVGFCEWQGKPAVIKLFFARQRAKKHSEKEIEGLNILEAQHVPSPQLYYQGTAQDKRVHVLIFERILKAKSMQAIWEARHLTSPKSALETLVTELATQHVFGALQQDCHLNNFLYTENKIYTLDGGRMASHPPLLPKPLSMENLAILLSQLGVGEENLQETLFYHYAKVRGWILKENDKRDLFFLIKQWNEKRWKSFSKKIQRNCSGFAAIKNRQWTGMYDRHFAASDLLHFFSEPDSVFHSPNKKILKDGRSSTVIQITLDQKKYVIKRYNMKSFGHFLRRALRTTRASAAWRLAQKLQLFGVPTAKPVGFLEYRFLGLCGKSYFITEYVEGEHAGEFFKRENNPANIQQMVKQIIVLLKNLAKLYITHGDVKVSNLIITLENQIKLIDLDGAMEHAALSSLHRSWRNDLLRFVKDFEPHSFVRKQFEEEGVNQ